MRKNPHVRICGGLGSATTLVYPTVPPTKTASLSRRGARSGAHDRTNQEGEGARTATVEAGVW